MMRIAMIAALATAGAAASGSIALAATHAPTEPGRALPANAAAQAQQHAAPVLEQHPAGKPADAGKPDSTHGPHGTPNPNLNGLCHAWLAGAGAEHGKARTNPAFSVLVSTAGGSGAVDGFCTELIGSSSHPSGESDEPNESDGPNADHPDQSSHPGNTDHPNRTSHPSGRPTATPPVTPPTHP